jgi:flagellar motor switch/type III secretory pathway protein FliN
MAMADTELATRSAEIALHAGLRLAASVQEVPWMMRIEEHTSWLMLARLPVTLTATISLNRFRVRDLMRLEKGQVFESAWPETEDVPLRTGDVQVGWGEFEVVDQRITVRLTRLA